MKVIDQLKENIRENIQSVFKVDLTDLELTLPPEERLGDYALPCFDLAKQLKNKPNEIAKQLVEHFKTDGLIDRVANFGPYLNIFVNHTFLKQSLEGIDKNFGTSAIGKKEKILIEFSGPNTNKPQHIGHLRNNCLGQALVNILKKCNYKVTPVNIINDRGIHIVKSMLAWQEFANNATPQTAKVKGDHFVGKYYVRFGQELAKEKQEYLDKHKIDLDKLNNLARKKAEDEFLNDSKLMQRARVILKAWEDGDKEVRKLWQTMNSWVYDGYKDTYNRLGIKFDKEYYESETYLLGKDLIVQGLKNNVFFQKKDGSIWVDLKPEGLDEKILLRSDGTSVYVTQDLGTAKQRYDQYKFDKGIYVVGSEQDYHFKVLFSILKKLNFDWAKKLVHLSYGLFSLPDGRIKSREGKTADADDLMDAMHNKARQIMSKAKKQVKTNDKQEEAIAEIVGLGALKFFVLGTNPQKNITFNPEESVSFDGYTGTFIQYTHARINTMLKKAKLKKTNFDIEFNEEEKKLVKLLIKYPQAIEDSALEYNPAILTQYLFNLSRTFNNFYQLHPVLKAENENLKQLRLHLSKHTQTILKDGLNLLGIEAPELM